IARPSHRGARGGGAESGAARPQTKQATELRMEARERRAGPRVCRGAGVRASPGNEVQRVLVALRRITAHADTADAQATQKQTGRQPGARLGLTGHGSRSVTTRKGVRQWPANAA